MSHIKDRLLCWGKPNKTRLNEVKVLINKALNCIYYKKYDEIVESYKE